MLPLLFSEVLNTLLSQEVELRPIRTSSLLIPAEGVATVAVNMTPALWRAPDRPSATLLGASSRAPETRNPTTSRLAASFSRDALFVSE